MLDVKRILVSVSDVLAQLVLPTSSDSGATSYGGVGLHDNTVLLARFQDVLVTAVRVELDLIQCRLHLASENDLHSGWLPTHFLTFGRLSPYDIYNDPKPYLSFSTLRSYQPRILYHSLDVFSGKVGHAKVPDLALLLAHLQSLPHRHPHLWCSRRVRSAVLEEGLEGTDQRII